MTVRGIRGAITVHENTEQHILEATTELIQAMVAANELQPADVGAIFITATPDLNATFPARAVRYLSGWEMVPLMCSQELDVPNGLPQCIRLMMMHNTSKPQAQIQHVYLREAVKLRPDLTST
jgi:chorismate mutase